jgi:hypothetical protein
LSRTAKAWRRLGTAVVGHSTFPGKYMASGRLGSS